MGKIIWKHRFLRRTRKVKCPDCGERTFVPFYNIETGQPFDGNNFGMCDRQHNCGCKRVPTWEDYKRLGILEFEDDVQPKPRKVHPKVVQRIIEEEDDEYNSIEPKELFSSITQTHKTSTLFQYLCFHWAEQEVRRVFQQYLVGYDRRWTGSPVFWYVDITGGIRSGKIMGYDPDTGKRVKKPFPQISWIHVRDKQLQEVREPTYKIKLCLYGEHLVEQHKKFSIVESEKTALICALEETDPTMCWLAVGGCENIKNSIFRVLEGRNAAFYPDRGKAYTKWKDKVQQLDSSIRKNFKVSNCLEHLDLPPESDIADYILHKKLNNK